MREEPFAPLDPGLYREVVRRALAEDLRWGDITTDAAVPAEARATGEVQTNTACVLAGLDIALEAFLQLDPKADVTRTRQDGETCEAGETILRLSGFASALLTAERTALNFLQRLSGIATLTRRFRRRRRLTRDDSRYAEDDTDAPGAGEVRCPGRWGGQSSPGARRWIADQGEPRASGWIDCRGGRQAARDRSRPADRSRGALP